MVGLRNSTGREAREAGPGASSRPRSLAVVGGKGGVGRSQVALNIAVHLGQQARVLLLDADLQGGDLATLSGLDRPAPPPPGAPPATSPVTEGLDLASLQALNESPPDVADLLLWTAAYDWLVLDTGTGVDETSLAPAWRADEALLVVAPELTAVADGYATLKALLQRRPGLPLSCVVNLADEEAEARDVQAGVAELAHAFLGAEIVDRGYIPVTRSVRTAARNRTPFVLASPSSPAAAAIARITSQLQAQAAPVRTPDRGDVVDGILQVWNDRSREPLQEVWATP